MTSRNLPTPHGADPPSLWYKDISDKLFNECYRTCHCPGDLQHPEILQLIYEANIMEVSPNLAEILKLYIDFISKQLWSWVFSKLKMRINKFKLTTLRKCLNYPSVLWIKICILKLLSYEGTISMHLKGVEKNIRDMHQEVH